MTQITDRFAFEYQVATEPRISYLICSVPRSGSSLLCELLAGTLHAGMPAEYFRPDVITRFKRRWAVETFDDYLRELIRRKTSPNGVFGLKVHWDQYETVAEEGDLARRLPNLHFVEARREDHVRQAVSWVRALQTGAWSSLIAPEAPRPAVFDREEIERKIGRLEREEHAWQEFFRRHEITPHRVSYEGLAQAPEQHVRELLEFLGETLPVDFEIEPAAMERQTDELSEEWVARYLAESGRA